MKTRPYRKLIAIGAALLCTLTSPVAAQQSPAEVSAAQVAEYKTGAGKACRTAGMSRGDPQAEVAASCTCLAEHLNKRMSNAEWQQAYYFARTGQDREEAGVLAPHVKDLSACRRKP